MLLVTYCFGDNGGDCVVDDDDSFSRHNNAVAHFWFSKVIRYPVNRINQKLIIEAIFMHVLNSSFVLVFFWTEV